MRKTMKKMFSVLLTMAVILSFSATAFAGDATVNYTGRQDLFLFQPGSSFTDTDLFSNFKEVMPGDSLNQKITLTNTAADCDYIKVYLRVIPHDDTANPLSRNVAATGETTESMTEFLNQLNLTVKNGEAVIYRGSPAAAGMLAEGILLGQLGRNQSLELNAQLSVPADMGNDFAFRAGEMDWAFTVEAFDNPSPPVSGQQLTVRKIWAGDDEKDRPNQVTVNLLKDGKVQETRVLNEANQWTWTWGNLSRWSKWTVEEAAVPEGYASSSETTGNTTFITNTKTTEGGDIIIPDPEKPAQEPVSLTAKKIWDDNDSEKRPDSAKITLYQGKEAVEAVHLGPWNDWTYTWGNLDANGDWSVVEDQVPKGYVPSYRVKNDVVTITNTAKLIQTGQRNWPVLLCGGLGILVLAAGVILRRTERKKENV
ncbi:MAG: Cna B-type domain-containing protein [Anaerovoracaceae bacterium]|nr:Cna B-type domain-containing protein [Anaerovoracaceae bacterium]